MPPLNLSGAWSGRWSSTDGEGLITLRLTQSGSTVTGSMELPGTSATGGTFAGTLTQTGTTSASIQWIVSYTYLFNGLPCQGSFGGPGTATATTIQGTYSGFDCRHTFSNGTLVLLSSSAPPSPVPSPSTKPLVVSASSLYRSDFAATGTDTLIGAFTLANRTPISVTDIATAPDGRTYAVSFGTLYSVDTATATVTPIGSGALPTINALASDSSGNLWGASLLDGSLHRINKNDGSTTLIGRFGSGAVSSGDLAFDSSGTLWATVRRSAVASDTLVTVNTATGAATSRITNMPSGTFGLVFLEGTLYGLASSTNSLYRIDTAGGVVTFVRRLSFTPALRAN